MDYTLFRRQLIYKNRTSLEELADEHEEITFLIDNMLDNFYFSSADGKDRALRCFNTAYYLCTLILLCESRPEWYFARYCDIAYCGVKDNKVYQSFTLSLVYIFLTHTYYEVQCEKLLKKMEAFFDKFGNALVWNDLLLDDYTYRDVYNDLLKNAPEDFLIGEEFSPRKIDRDIFIEVDGPGDVWSKLTNNYDRKEIRKIVDSLGKNEEEKHLLIELISRDARRYYSASGGYYHETVKPMLDEMDEWIFHEYNDEALQELSEAELAEMKHLDDIRFLQEQIAPATINPENDKPNQPLSDAQKTIEKQAQIIKELQAEVAKFKSVSTANVDMDKDYNDVNKWAKVIFFATVLNTAYQKKYTIGQQLAHFICMVCGGKPSTYQPLISKIASMEDNEKDNSGETYIPQVIKAAKEIVNRLVEIPEGESVPPTIQKYIDSICDEFSIEKPKKKTH